MLKTFTQKVLAVVKKIKPGTTLSYKQVAQLAGSPLAARSVGSIMKNNLDPSVPCHRVIRSDGKPCGYNRGGPSRKMQLLEEEKANTQS